MTGGVVFRRLVIVTGIGIVKTNCPARLKSYENHLGIIEVWARDCGTVVLWLSLAHNSIQRSLDSGSAQVQVLLVASWRFAMARISGPG